MLTSVTRVPARRMLERAGRADPVAGQREVQVVAPQRIEARIGVAVGQQQLGVGAEVAVMDQPRARRLAHQQRDVADRRARAAKSPLMPLPTKLPVRRRGIEYDG